MCAPSPPAAPNPADVSAAQTASNEATARLNATLNRVDTTTPWGNLKYTQNGDKWNQDITLGQDQQNLLNLNNATSYGTGLAANHLLGQVQDSYAKPLDFGSLPKAVSSVAPQGALQTGAMQNLPAYKTSAGPTAPIQHQLQTGPLPSLTQDYSADRDKVVQALNSRIDPQLDQQRQALESRLANQGITQGSDAYANAMQQQQQGVNDAHMQSTLAGSQEQSRLAALAAQTRGQLFGEAQTKGNFGNAAQGQEFSQGMANAQLNNSAREGQFGEQLQNAQLNNMAQGQAFGQGVTNANLTNSTRAQMLQELMTQQNAPLNALSALRSNSQVSQPNFQQAPQTAVAPTNVSGDIWNAYGIQSNNANAATASQNGLLGTLGSLGAMAYMFSDSRLKADIKRIGYLDTGLPVYSYRYKGDLKPQIGVMAQEAEITNPDAVATHPSGYKMVNYGKL